MAAARLRRGAPDGAGRARRGVRRGAQAPPHLRRALRGPQAPQRYLRARHHHDGVDQDSGGRLGTLGTRGRDVVPGRGGIDGVPLWRARFGHALQRRLPIRVRHQLVGAARGDGSGALAAPSCRARGGGRRALRPRRQEQFHPRRPVRAQSLDGELDGDDDARAGAVRALQPHHVRHRRPALLLRRDGRARGRHPPAPPPRALADGADVRRGGARVPSRICRGPARGAQAGVDRDGGGHRAQPDAHLLLHVRHALPLPGREPQARADGGRKPKPGGDLVGLLQERARDGLPGEGARRRCPQARQRQEEPRQAHVEEHHEIPSLLLQRRLLQGGAHARVRRELPSAVRGALSEAAPAPALPAQRVRGGEVCVHDDPALAAPLFGALRLRVVRPLRRGVSQV
mmetsp:Transcript_1066/g.3942  ORF Transcript_1066/g.3942 Transcript_1066/m.3942 type:complete len:400 (-) Transcript_1066:87-1286(-)